MLEQHESCIEYETAATAQIAAWRLQMRAWEHDRTQPNPLEVSGETRTFDMLSQLPHIKLCFQSPRW